jgi:hypothetical protein
VLNLYRRHQASCRYRSRRFRVCNCPIWVQGSLRGEYIRRGLNLRSWSAATDLVRDWEAAGEIGVVKKPDIPTIVEAVELFLQDARAQKLSPETIRKYENLLNRRLTPWCAAKGYRYLKQLSVERRRGPTARTTRPRISSASGRFSGSARTTTGLPGIRPAR